MFSLFAASNLNAQREAESTESALIREALRAIQEIVSLTPTTAPSLENR